MKKRIVGIVGVFCVPVLLFLLFSLTTIGFGVNSILIVLSQSMVPTCIGYGFCILMMCGLMDMSVSCRMIFAAVVGAVFYQFAGFFGFIIGVIIGAFASSFIIAIMYKYMKIPAIVISLGSVLVFEALSYKIAGIVGITNSITIPESVYRYFTYPYNILWTIIAGIALYLLNYRTKIGGHLSAVGNDEVLASSLGINPSRVKTIAYLLSAIFVAIAAYLQISYSGMLGIQLGSATMGMIFKPMMGVIVGMALMPLWNNMPVLIALGEISIAIIFNGLIAAGLDDFYQNLVLGFFILIVLGVSGNIGSIREKMRRSSVMSIGPSAYSDVKENELITE